MKILDAQYAFILAHQYNLVDLPDLKYDVTWLADDDYWAVIASHRVPVSCLFKFNADDMDDLEE